jgi:hypothetical protein
VTNASADTHDWSTPDAVTSAWRPLRIASSNVVGAGLAIAIVPKHSRHTAGRRHRVVAEAKARHDRRPKMKGVVGLLDRWRVLLSDTSHAPRPFRPSDHCSFARGATAQRACWPFGPTIDLATVGRSEERQAPWSLTHAMAAPRLGELR